MRRNCLIGSLWGKRSSSAYWCKLGAGSHGVGIYISYSLVPPVACSVTQTILYTRYYDKYKVSKPAFILWNLVLLSIQFSQSSPKIEPHPLIVPPIKYTHIYTLAHMDECTYPACAHAHQSLFLSSSPWGTKVLHQLLNCLNSLIC